MKTGNYINVAIIVTLALAALNLSCDDDKDAGPVIPAEMIYEETFETDSPFSTAYNKEIGNWDYALQYVNSPVFEGTRCARFEIRADQEFIAEGKRAEVTIVKESQGHISNNNWYSFAFYLPTDGFAPDHEYDVISQWYESGSPVRLMIKGDTLVLEIGRIKGSKGKIKIQKLTKDTWHQVVFHIIHSNGNDGLIDVWLNGKKKVTRAGGNTYYDAVPKWKVGIYKPAYTEGTSSAYNRVVYFDNIRVADENANYNFMVPKKTN